jgi:cyclopropane fatty-acyl-phospholipid synthase-like methyltransferase
MTDIYNDNSYLEKNPSLHTEDSKFKFQNIKRFLSSIEVKNNRIKILDIGGGAGIIGKLVLEHFQESGIVVTFHSLDLSTQMLKIQLKNNPQIKKIINCSINECPKSNYDLVLMIDVIEHIEEKEDSAKILNKLGKNIIYNIPIEINFFDILKYLKSFFRYYKRQKERWGHIHFFSFTSSQSFLRRHYKIIDSYFQPYCFHYRYSDNESYLKLRRDFLWKIELKISCWIFNNFQNISKYLIQGSNYSLVKTKNNFT